MANVAMRFATNLQHEVMNPMRIAYDTGFGVLGTVLIDSVGFDSVLNNIATSVDLSPQRTNQLGAGLTFSTLNLLERSTMNTLGGRY